MTRTKLDLHTLAANTRVKNTLTGMEGSILPRCDPPGNGKWFANWYCGAYIRWDDDSITREYDRLLSDVIIVA